MLQCVCVTIHVSCLDLLNTSTPEQCSLAQADPTPVQDPTRSFLSTLHPHDIYPWHGLNLLEHLCLEKITSFECTISLSPIFFLIYNNDPGCITHPFSLTISYGLNPLYVALLVPPQMDAHPSFLNAGSQPLFRFRRIRNGSRAALGRRVTLGYQPTINVSRST